MLLPVCTSPRLQLPTPLGASKFELVICWVLSAATLARAEGRGVLIPMWAFRGQARIDVVLSWSLLLSSTSVGGEMHSWSSDDPALREGITDNKRRVDQHLTAVAPHFAVMTRPYSVVGVACASNHDCERGSLSLVSWCSLSACSSCQPIAEPKYYQQVEQKRSCFGPVTRRGVSGALRICVSYVESPLPTMHSSEWYGMLSCAWVCDIRRAFQSVGRALTAVTTDVGPSAREKSTLPVRTHFCPHRQQAVAIIYHTQ